MNLLRHRYASGKSDGPDVSQIQPSHWNDGHFFTGGNAGDVVMRDLADPTYGVKWAPAGFKILESTDIGVRHDWTPAGFGTENAIIHWQGASDLSVTGLAVATSVVGQIVTLRNRSGGLIYVFNEWAESTSQFRFYNVVKSAPVMIATGGYMTWVRLAGGWLQMAHDQGAFVTPPFNAAEYYGSGGMTWTVGASNVTQCSFRLSGTMLSWSMYLSTTTLGGAPASAVFRSVPGGYDPRTYAPVLGTVHVGEQMAVLGLHEPGNKRIHLIRDAAQFQTFPIGTMHVHLTAACEVQ